MYTLCAINLFKLRIAQIYVHTVCTHCTLCTVCTRINYKIVPLTNLTKFWHYGTSWTENTHTHHTILLPKQNSSNESQCFLFIIFHCRYLHIYIYISFMQLGHLLTRSGLTYTEVPSKVYHDSFCQLGSSVTLPWVIYFEAFYLHRMPRNLYIYIMNKKHCDLFELFCFGDNFMYSQIINLSAVAQLQWLI